MTHLMVLVGVTLGAVSLLLCLWGALVLSRQVTRPVREMTAAMKRVQLGELSARVVPRGEGELGQLAVGFNQMVAECELNLRRSVERQKELNDTRIRMMQSQLNPHFLYNTLDSMKWMGVTHGVPQVATLAEDLAKILRASISGDEFVTLGQELELLERYIDIQLIRFEDRFACEIEVDDALMGCMVPKLVLQPIVENAVIHGVRDMDDGYIKIWAETDAGDLRLFVQDNGRGMEKPQDGLWRIRPAGRAFGHVQRGQHSAPAFRRRIRPECALQTGRGLSGDGTPADEEGEGMIRVLMVDDEPLVRRGIVAGVDWAALGCEVVGEAQSGEEGLELARRLKPELIITDIRMPKMDGITMMNLLREEGCAAHCIVLTAHSDFEYARGALLFGADDYLLKPFRDQELTHAVARVCRRMQPVSAAPAPKEKEPEATGYVRQAMDYIAEHYADADISIAVIAEHLRVSEGHLSHVFKKQTGMTVTNYLTKTRIDAAMRMLSRDHVKVYEAAAAVGYKDVTYFSATFKKLTGLSPSEVE